MSSNITLAELFAAYPGYLYLAVGLLGLVVGSFLNVVILRIPVMLERAWYADSRELLGMEAEAEEEPISLAFPGSHCPSCKAAIKPWQNIPVLSYLILRGRCGNCDKPIGWRYPAVESLCAIVSVIVASHTGWGISLLAFLVFSWSLLALAVIDVDTQLLPDNITLPLLWLGLLFNLLTGSVELADAVMGACFGYLLLWSVYWLFKLVTGKEGMGFGDFKLLAALGAWLGWQAIPLIVLLSSAVGAMLGIVIIAAMGKDRSHPLPFGPYLAIAGWIVMIWGSELSAALLGQAL